MTRTETAPRAEPALIIDILRAAATGVFPGLILESLIDRLEDQR